MVLPSRCPVPHLPCSAPKSLHKALARMKEGPFTQISGWCFQPLWEKNMYVGWLFLRHGKKHVPNHQTDLQMKHYHPHEQLFAINLTPMTMGKSPNIIAELPVFPRYSEGLNLHALDVLCWSCKTCHLPSTLGKIMVDVTGCDSNPPPKKKHPLASSSQA